MFQRQVATQCFAALMAAETAQSALNPVNQDVFWASIQNCLTAVANISKAMWGQGGKYSKERKPLRDSLGVGNNSPLKRTSMRNNFEHFDERLEKVELLYLEELMKTADANEGLNAFLEKRKPAWKGRQPPCAAGSSARRRDSSRRSRP